MADNKGKRTPPSLDAAVQSHIGRRLRSIFDEVASQPVPDRFLALLDQLETSGEDPASAATGGGREKLEDMSEVGASGASK